MYIIPIGWELRWSSLLFMTLLLITLELALLGKMLYSYEFSMRPCFFLFLLWQALSGLLYPLSRGSWLKMAAVTDGLLLLVLCEALWWMADSSQFLPILGFGIWAAAYPTRFALLGLPDHPAGTPAELGWALRYFATAAVWFATVWLFSLLMAVWNQAVRMKSLGPGVFDWALLGWLAVKAAGALGLYYIPRGVANLEWIVWNETAEAALVLCVLAWLVTGRELEYVRRQVVAERKSGLMLSRMGEGE